MFEDGDMKIAGEKPSKEIENAVYPLSGEEYQRERINGNIEKAKKLGQAIARVLVDNSKSAISQEHEAAIESQKILLLSVTATTAFESFCPNQVTANTALNAFFDRLKALDEEIYEDCCDSGAYSFYFLAYKSGNDIERRMGQTFAMVCGHDGDPIYQELGEALYCWFLGVVKQSITDLQFIGGKL